MSIQTKDLIRYNNHITYYKKITQISSKNPTIIRQTDSRTPRFTSSDSRKFFRFSKLRKLRGGEAFIVAKGHFPSSRSSPPATQITVGCGDVFRYWRGDGCCGIGYETLCRSIPILHNFFQSLTYSHQVTRNPNLSSLPSSAALTAHPTPEQPPPTHTTALKSQPVRRVLPVDGLSRRGADSWLAEICVASKILTV